MTEDEIRIKVYTRANFIQLLKRYYIPRMVKGGFVDEQWAVDEALRTWNLFFVGVSKGKVLRVNLIEKGEGN